MKKALGITAGIALALSLGACGTTANTITAAPEAATTTTAPAPVQNVANFGDTITLPDGVAITTTATVRPAGKYASGAVEGKIVVVTVSAKNTTTATVNAAIETWPKVNYGEKGVPAESATDDALSFSSIGQLLPGETQTVQHGYGIPSAGLSSVRVEFTSLDYHSQPAVFKGAVK